MIRRNPLTDVSLAPYQGGMADFPSPPQPPANFGAPPELNIQPMDMPVPPQPPQEGGMGDAIGQLGTAFINRPRKPRASQMYDSPVSLKGFDTA